MARISEDASGFLNLAKKECTMAISYYIDESGHSGDLIKSGNALDFDGQPFFSLACIGVDDETRLNDEIARLKLHYRFESAELKSALLKSNPNFVVDLVELLCKDQHPFFIEMVDKKYFLCANIVNCQILPLTSGLEIGPLDLFVRNRFADYLYDHASIKVFEAFIAACAYPSEQTLRESIIALQSMNERDGVESDVAQAIRLGAAKCLDEYETMKQRRENAHLNYLPHPDEGKRSKLVWITPNLSSFCNIYARINLFHGGNLSGVRIIHDEQKHLDKILEAAKQNTERLLKDGARVYTPHADYRFTQSAPLFFADSHRSIGIQTADMLAGLTMRYFKARAIDTKSISPQLAAAIDMLLDHSVPPKGMGLNLVVPSKSAIPPRYE